MKDVIESTVEEIEVEEVEETTVDGMSEEEILAKAKAIHKERFKANAKKFGVAACCVLGAGFAIIKQIGNSKNDTLELSDGRKLILTEDGYVFEDEEKVE